MRTHATNGRRAGVRHVRVAALAVATVLVLARSAPFALFEQIQFDSDQAVFGLMAKHLAEGRAFPLFMYGQPYLLAVDSWLAAPWFLVAPASLLTLSLSLALLNVATAALLIVSLEKWGGLHPLGGLVAALFFIVPPPVVARDLMSISGGNVAPFFYVCVLWWLRQRPFAFGAVLGLGFLHREFTMYAVPILLAADLWRGRLLEPAVIQRWLLAAVAAMATWEVVVALQPWADLMGPGTRGHLLAGFAASPFGNLAGRAHVVPSDIASHARDFVLVYVPRLLGVRTVSPDVSIRTWLAWPLVLVALMAIGRIALLLGRGGVMRRAASAPFAWYLAGIGIVAALAFVATHPVNEEYARYGLLVMLVPVGLTAGLLALEPRRWVRLALGTLVIAWASIPAIDTAVLATNLARSDDPAELRTLTDGLLARGVTVASASYWTAYAVTFLSNEQVKVAATDHPRITEYQRLAASEPHLVTIREHPCPGGEPLARWYLCRD